VSQLAERAGGSGPARTGREVSPASATGGGPPSDGVAAEGRPGTPRRLADHAAGQPERCKGGRREGHS